MNKSFKERVAKFWVAFAEEEAELRALIDDKVQGETMVKFVNGMLSIAFENPYFQVGKNSEGKYELIMTPEGNKVRYMQLYYWLQMAPPLLGENWNFYASKPANPDSGFDLDMFDITLKNEDITLYCHVNYEQKKINLQVYSPKILSLDEEQQYGIFFIMIDEYIGELYTMEYIGYIDFIDSEFEEDEEDEDVVLKLSELKTFIDTVIENEKWEKETNPAHLFQGYEMKPKQDDDWKLREDVAIGISSCFPALNAFYKKDDALFKEMKQDGIVLGFLFYNNTQIPRDKVVTFRSSIEDKILEIVQSEKIADSIGGATGFHFSYMDFIIYDIDAFKNIAKQVLAEYKFEESGYADFVFDANPEMFKV